MQHDCWATTIEERRGPCEFGDRSSATTLVLLGDSHAEHWLGALDRAGRERGFKVIAMVKGGCPVPDMPELMQPRLKRWYHECTRFREAMIRRIIALRPAAVILSSWDHYMPLNGNGSDWQVTPDIWRRGLRRTYTRLSAAGIKTVAMRGTPRTWFDVPGCLSRQAAQLPAARRCEYERARAFSPVAIAAQNEAARGLPVRFVDMNDIICKTSPVPGHPQRHRHLHRRQPSHPQFQPLRRSSARGEARCGVAVAREQFIGLSGFRMLCSAQPVKGG
ncbi:MAG: SGNH hydrolase domain-containing protein [Gemmatimonadaceae bacterium]